VLQRELLRPAVDDALEVAQHLVADRRLLGGLVLSHLAQDLLELRRALQVGGRRADQRDGVDEHLLLLLLRMGSHRGYHPTVNQSIDA
jgi:hypothetical protein